MIYYKKHHPWVVFFDFYCSRLLLPQEQVLT